MYENTICFSPETRELEWQIKILRSGWRSGLVCPSVKREVIRNAQRQFGTSERYICRVFGQARSSQRYNRRRQRSDKRAKFVLKLSKVKPYLGYRRVWLQARQTGHSLTLQNVRRIREDHLLSSSRSMESSEIKRGRRSHRQREVIPGRYRDDVWAIDATTVHSNRGAEAVLVGIDEYTRECIVLDVASEERAWWFRTSIEEAVVSRGVPTSIRLDNAMLKHTSWLKSWCCSSGIEIRLCEPGKPWQNSFAESFISRLKDEVRFRGNVSTQAALDAWRVEYNYLRPHSGINNFTPQEMADLSVSKMPKADTDFWADPWIKCQGVFVRVAYARHTIPKPQVQQASCC